MTTSTEPEKLAKLSLEELQKQLKASTQGLITKEAGDRLLRDGENELSEDDISPIMQFLAHFWGADRMDDRGGGGFSRHWGKQRAYGVFNHEQPVYIAYGLRKLHQWFSHYHLRKTN